MPIPQKPKGLAKRRHHRQRMLSHAKHIIGCVWGDTALLKATHKWADNMKKCSCEMCQPGSSGLQVKRAAEREAWEMTRLRENYKEA